MQLDSKQVKENEQAQFLYEYEDQVSDVPSYGPRHLEASCAASLRFGNRIASIKSFSGAASAWCKATELVQRQAASAQKMEAFMRQQAKGNISGET